MIKKLLLLFSITYSVYGFTNSVFDFYRQGDYIAYSDSNNLYPDSIKIRGGVYNVGDTFNFQGVGVTSNNRAYAVTATTENSRCLSCIHLISPNRLQFKSLNKRNFMISTTDTI